MFRLYGWLPLSTSTLSLPPVVYLSDSFIHAHTHIHTKPRSSLYDDNDGDDDRDSETVNHILYANTLYIGISYVQYIKFHMVKVFVFSIGMAV